MSVTQTLPSGSMRSPCGGLDVLVAPGAEELAVAVEDEDGLFAAVGDVDPVLRVGRHGGHRAELDVGRQLRPTGDGAVIGDRLGGPGRREHKDQRQRQSQGSEDAVCAHGAGLLQGFGHGWRRKPSGRPR